MPDDWNSSLKGSKFFVILLMLRLHILNPLLCFRQWVFVSLTWFESCGTRIQGGLGGAPPPEFVLLVSLKMSTGSPFSMNLGPVALTVGVILGPVLNLSKSFQINCVKR